MRQTGFHRTVWRWHFYAGLFVIPFILILSATGASCPRSGLDDEMRDGVIEPEVAGEQLGHVACPSFGEHHQRRRPPIAVADQAIPLGHHTVVGPVFREQWCPQEAFQFFGRERFGRLP